MRMLLQQGKDLSLGLEEVVEVELRTRTKIEEVNSSNRITIIIKSISNNLLSKDIKTPTSRDSHNSHRVFQFKELQFRVSQYKDNLLALQISLTL